MKIYIEYASSEYTLDVAPETTLQNLKLRIFQLTRIPVPHQALYMGETLLYGDLPLSTLGIPNGVTLSLSISSPSFSPALFI